MRFSFRPHRAATFEAARSAREAGATVFAIGVGVTSYYDLREMRGIASDPDSETVFIVPDYESLSGIIAPLVNAVCNGKYEYPVKLHVTAIS